MGDVTIIHGDCLDVLRGMPDNSVDSVVTDPPYGLAFMGKKWDYDVPDVEVWSQCLRVLKPGGHLLAFAGTRTQHRMAVRIEDAGFEIRDMIAWVYGSGFPKSLDVSKAIDKAAGAEREVVGTYHGATNIGKKSDGKRGYGCDGQDTGGTDTTVYQTAPATDAARQWSGWGTALKPALEPITMARKPFASTVAANVTQWGTGAINVDRCRVGTEAVTINTWDDGAKPFGGGAGHAYTGRMVSGRWPANLVHDGSDEVLAGFPSDGDKSAARFFYCPKASKAERDAGCDGMPTVDCGTYAQDEWTKANMGGFAQQRRNHHPTVKPAALMAYLCRLVTPPGGTILDPFAGSGSTGIGASRGGFKFIGIEKESEYVEIANRRIAHVVSGGS